MYTVISWPFLKAFVLIVKSMSDFSKNSSEYLWVITKENNLSTSVGFL